MPLTPGLSPSVRLEDDQQPAPINGEDIQVEIISGGKDQPDVDMDGNILRI